MEERGSLVKNELDLANADYQCSRHIYMDRQIEESEMIDNQYEDKFGCLANQVGAHCLVYHFLLHNYWRTSCSQHNQPPSHQMVPRFFQGQISAQSSLDFLSFKSKKVHALYIYINWQSIGKSCWRFCRCLITHLSLILLPHTHKDIVKFITLVHTHVNTCISIKLATLFLLFIFYYFNSFEFFGSAFMHQNQGCFKLSCIYII